MKNVKITVKKPTWLDQITRLDGTIIPFGETNSGIHPPFQETYKRNKKDENNSSSSSNQ